MLLNLSLAFLVVFSSFVAMAENTLHPISSFRQAKKLATILYKDHKTTFYCGCDYTDKKLVKPGKCGYQARKNKKRGKRIEWEHVVPAHAFGHSRQCWREPESFEACQKKSGEFYRGRKCCNKVDPMFRAMAADLHNLVPAVGELNGDRSNFRFGMIEGEPRSYGACDFEVDFKHRVVEPAPHVRGNIARIYRYMEKTYGIVIGKKQRRLFDLWAKQDPVDESEKRKSAHVNRLYTTR